MDILSAIHAVHLAPCMPSSYAFFTPLLVWMCALTRFCSTAGAETAELKKLNSQDAPFDPKLASEMHVTAELLQATNHYQGLRAVLDSARNEIAGVRNTLFDKSENRKQIPTRSSI